MEDRNFVLKPNYKRIGCLLRRFYFLLIAFSLSIFSIEITQAANTTISPEAILEAARVQPTTRPFYLAAEIRGDEETLPLRIKIDRGFIEYQLTNPNQTITLKLSPTTTELQNKTSQGKTAIDEKQRHQEIRHTGVTYDDLSLGFLYWPHPRLLKEDSIRGQKTWLLELNSSANDTPYGAARLSIDEQNGALLRMEGFDKNGRLLKRFEVISAQKIDHLWMLKEMRIETFDPTTQRVIQRRYLDIKKGNLQG